MLPDYLIGDCEAIICRNTACAKAVKQNPETGRYFITMGHPGFNSRANNGSGYATQAAALAAFHRYGAYAAR